MGILSAFIIALAISFLFAGSRKDSISALFIFFFVLFFAGLASMFWIVPFGPMMWGVSWLPMLFFILIVASLFSAPPPRQRKIKADEKAEEAASSAAAMSVFIWLLFFLLLVAVIVGFYRTR